MVVFVRARKHRCTPWGVGKAIDFGDTTATVAWFDSPVTEARIENIPLDHIEHVLLAKQTRVYWRDPLAEVWRVGRILDADDTKAEVRFANKVDRYLALGELEVRWDRPIEDPSAFLAEHINESPLLAAARSGFARSLVAQRGACAGMSALISSVIELEQHQVEVVRRVLQDPVQRYLLADEVGLGKTIEAGVLIRQYVLDDPIDHRILVLVPAALAIQWRRELRTRFLLGNLLDESIRVVPLDRSASHLLESIRWAGMVVIDEAHHLSREPELYQALREAIIDAPRLLLLSATPVLHNERGFLEMLHLLDPHVFALEREEAFRQRIEHRQALAESVAGLVPENMLQIEDFLDDLEARFPDDDLLRTHIAALRDIVIDFPEETDAVFVEALTTLRAHLSETYRLDRRILRNRRRNLPFLTPARAGVELIDYASPATGRLVHAAEAWRNAAAEALYGSDDSSVANRLAQWFRDLLEATQTNPARVVEMARIRADGPEDGVMDPRQEAALLNDLAQAASECMEDRDRIEALLSLVRGQFDGRAKLVVFCSDADVADGVADELAKHLPSPVDRHRPHQGDEDDDSPRPWERFLSDPGHRVLVCDRAAEEGLNLQGGAKVMVHFDLPLAPNRIEQRLGRADRYGTGDAIRSVALRCVDDPYAGAWADYLDDGLGLFERSVASLQYLIDEEVQALAGALLIEGVEALRDLAERTRGKQGMASRELRRIDDQDALDALTVPREDSFEALSEVDADWRGIAECVDQWMLQILQVDAEEAPVERRVPFGFGTFRFCLAYGYRGSNTLIPLQSILSSLLGLLDIDARGAHSKLLKTYWYSCRRGSAGSASALAKGIRLVRWGEEFVDRIQQLMDRDDRGRSAAMWRQLHGYQLRSDEVADLFLRFDFIVEADVDEVLRAAGEDDALPLRKALARRADMALPPFYKTVWLDETLALVQEPNRLSLLEAPYQKESGDSPYRDWNLNQDRWPRLTDAGLAVMDAWPQWIMRSRTSAESTLRSETDLEGLCVQAVERAKILDEGRFAQLRTRMQYAEANDAQALGGLLVREERIAEALYSGILHPRITLGTIIAVFVSPHPLVGIGAE